MLKQANYKYFFVFMFLFIVDIFIFYKIIRKGEYAVLENKLYGFNLSYKKSLFVVGKEDFIKISDRKIEKDLSNNQCVLNIFSEESNYNICEYAKQECSDIGCNNFVCEKYYKDWYKVIEFGDFVGSGDIMLGYKNRNFAYFLNLECEEKKDDNLNNPLFLEVIKDIKNNK